MKKKIIILTLALTMSALTACSSQNQNTGSNELENPKVEDAAVNNSNEEHGDSEGQKQEGIPVNENSDNRILIAYFTMPETDGTDAVSSASRVVAEDKVIGSTELMAFWIQEKTGGELFKIETIQTYPGSHDELVALADEEQEQNARPELKELIENLDDYDTIFIGTPNWWGDMPMPMYTFFEEQDFAGKTIIPFNTNGGSGFTSIINTITNLEPDATVEQNGITISRNVVSNAQEEVIDWLEGLGY